MLVLSCRTGQGHEAAALAVAEEFAVRGVPCLHHDVSQFADRDNVPSIVKDHIVKGTYDHLVLDHPNTFKYLLQIGDLISSPRHRSPLYLANSTYAGNLGAFIEAEGIDTVVSTHMFPAQALTALVRRGLRVRSYAVVTDYLCLPFWEECAIDRYIVPHRDVVPEFVGRGIPDEKILALGLPVGRAFRSSQVRDEARLELGVPLSGTVYLVLTGSMGFGDPEVLADRLAVDDAAAFVIVVTGHNDALRQRLAHRYRDKRWFRAVGFTDKIATYMDASDVVLSKPGGLTSTEAAAKRRPLVHTPAIPGFEARNARFFSERGMSRSADDDVGAADAASDLAHDPEACAAMARAQRTNVDPLAACRICEYIAQEATGMGVSRVL